MNNPFLDYCLAALLLFFALFITFVLRFLPKRKGKITSVFEYRLTDGLFRVFDKFVVMLMGYYIAEQLWLILPILLLAIGAIQYRISQNKNLKSIVLHILSKIVLCCVITFLHKRLLLMSASFLIALIYVEYVIIRFENKQEENNVLTK